MADNHPLLLTSPVSKLNYSLLDRIYSHCTLLERFGGLLVCKSWKEALGADIGEIQRSLHNVWHGRQRPKPSALKADLRFNEEFPSCLWMARNNSPLSSVAAQAAREAARQAAQRGASAVLPGLTTAPHRPPWTI